MVPVHPEWCLNGISKNLQKERRTPCKIWGFVLFYADLSYLASCYSTLVSLKGDLRLLYTRVWSSAHCAERCAFKFSRLKQTSSNWIIFRGSDCFYLPSPPPLRVTRVRRASFRVWLLPIWSVIGWRVCSVLPISSMIGRWRRAIANRYWYSTRRLLTGWLPYWACSYAIEFYKLAILRTAVTMRNLSGSCLWKMNLFLKFYSATWPSFLYGSPKPEACWRWELIHRLPAVTVI